MLRILKRATQLNASRWGYLLNAVRYLFVSRIEHSVCSAKVILQRLENAPRRTAPQRVSFDPPQAGWAIGVVARYVPWRSDCLIQVMAAMKWLRRRGYEPTFQLGVAQSKTGVVAHAWLTLQDAVIVGGDTATDFKLLQLVPRGEPL